MFVLNLSLNETYYLATRGSVVYVWFLDSIFKLKLCYCLGIENIKVS